MRRRDLWDVEFLSDSKSISVCGFEYRRRYSGFVAEGGRRNGMGNVFLIAVAICNGPKIFNILELNICWKVSIEGSSANDDNLWCDVRDCESVGENFCAVGIHWKVQGDMERKV